MISIIAVPSSPPPPWPGRTVTSGGKSFKRLTCCQVAGSVRQYADPDARAVDAERHACVERSMSKVSFGCLAALPGWICTCPILHWSQNRFQILSHSRRSLRADRD